MTFNELIARAKAHGANLAEVAIGRMMIIIEEQTGEFPNYNDIAPDWVVKNVLG